MMAIGTRGLGHSREAPVKKTPTPATKPTARVMVVDDEALIRWSVAETLSSDGMAVTQAHDGASALAQLRAAAEPFDVVVVDLRLPDVDDLTLVAAVRAMSPSSAVIVMTAFGSHEITAQAWELGAAHILNKPFELGHLLRLVQEAVNEGRKPPS
jgi:DNA-binding NtrC family response regulator